LNGSRAKAPVPFHRNTLAVKRPAPEFPILTKNSDFNEDKAMLKDTKIKFKPHSIGKLSLCQKRRMCFYKEMDLLLQRKTIFNLSLRTSFVKQSKLFIDLISGGSKITFANREAKLVSVWL